MNKILPYYGMDYQEDGISIPPGNPGFTDVTNSVILDDSTISHMKYSLDPPQNTPEPATTTTKPPIYSQKKIYCIQIFMTVVITLAFATGGYFGYKINEDLLNKYDDLLSKIKVLNSTVLSNKEESTKADEKLTLSIENVSNEVGKYHAVDQSEEEPETTTGIINSIKAGDPEIKLSSLLYTSSSESAKIQLKWVVFHMLNPECRLNGTSLGEEKVTMEDTKEIIGLSSDSVYKYELTCTDEDSESVSKSTSGFIPILITTCQELEDIGSDAITVSKHYGLLHDIDCSATSGTLFTPIGSVDYFRGSLDGFNHSINDLTIDDLGTARRGLISQCDACSISNLKLNNIDITGGTITGCLVGWATKEMIIINVHIQGILLLGSGIRNHIGGILGKSDGSVYIAYSSVDLVITSTGGHRKGGFIGEAKSVTIIQSFTKGTFIVGNGNHKGGLIGYIEDYFYIRDSYSGMNLLGNDLSGIIGKNNGDDTSQMLNTYQVGTLNGGGSSEIIIRIGNCVARNIYWDKDQATPTSSDYGTGLDVSEIKQKKYFYGFDFDNVWYINEGVDSPRLRWELL